MLKRLSISPARERSRRNSIRRTREGETPVEPQLGLPWFSHSGQPREGVLARALLAIVFLAPSLFASGQSTAGAAPASGGVRNGTYPLPPISLHHLQTLTDNTGIHEFARGTVPWHENGYCAEDVARALAAVTLYEQATGKSDGRSLARVYLSYLSKSTREDGQVWNRMEKVMASGDSYGRVLYGLGYAASFHPDPAVSKPAGRLFERLLPGHEQKLGDYPIARACAMQGLAGYLSKHPSAAVRAALIKCAEANLAVFQQHSSGLWKWFGDTMTYDTGRLPLALLLAFQATGETRFRQAGLDSLDFLLATCFRGDGTQLSLVGNKGWYKKGGTPARFDQQPIDAASIVEACGLAWRITGETKYSQRAWSAFGWFLGENLKQAAMYDPVSAGCHDGLTESGPNANEGAESTIMYVIARCTMEELAEGCRQMTDLARRFPQNPLLRPSDLQPSRPDWQVECLLNPGVFDSTAGSGLLVRVAERPPQREGYVSFPVRSESGEARVLEFDRNDPRLDLSDPRVLRYDGVHYLTTLSHLRLFSSDDGMCFREDPAHPPHSWTRRVRNVWHRRQPGFVPGTGLTT